MPSRRALILLALSALVILTAASLFPRLQTFAAPALQETPTPEQPPAATQPPTGNLSIGDDVCLGCHGQPGQTMTLENGEILELYVPPEMHQGSIHGQLGYACVQCHTTVGEYPHPKFTASDRRNVTEQINETCARCHRQQSDFTKDSAHEAARERGVREAALCVDCHTAHEVRQLHDHQTGQLLKTVKTWIPERCALCHNAIYQKYRQSVHGSALSEGNPDVPTCIDCHGVHNIADPRTAAFRLKSPEICAKCHTNPALMSKYGLPTDVLNTYVADFHGQTVALFEKQSPDAQVNKPVCYDCHGVHDISRVDDPHTGLEMQQNLLARCQVCHPDASTNFPAAWMSHYIPSPQHYALVYYVNLFYKFFIPLTLGAMALLVVMDASRTLINRTRRRRKVVRHPKEEMAEAQPVQAAESQTEPAVIAPEATEVNETMVVEPSGDVEQTDVKTTEAAEAVPPAADEAFDTKLNEPDQAASEPPETDASDSEVEHG
jgi:Cytochrome c552